MYIFRRLSPGRTCPDAGTGLGETPTRGSLPLVGFSIGLYEFPHSSSGMDLTPIDSIFAGMQLMHVHHDQQRPLELNG